MSGEFEKLELDAEQLAAQAKLQELGTPMADAEFQARLRASFVRPAAKSRVLSPRRWSPQRWSLSIAVAAAVVFMVVTLNRTPGWELLSSSGVETVLVDGEPIQVEDLDSVLSPGSRIEVGAGGRLELLAPGCMIMQIEDAVAVTLPPPPGKWFARNVSADIAGTGRVRLATGPGLAGGSLFMRSGVVAEWRVTGTTFAIVSSNDEVRLSVLDGVLHACSPGEPMDMVAPGQRSTFQRGRLTPEFDDIEEGERLALLSFKSRAVAILASR